MNEEIFFVRLRDCFAAGYNLPQFCIDNNIKKPRFMTADEKHWQFLWEIFVQFSHDKRIKPEFAFLNGKTETVTLSPGTLFNELKINSADDANLNNCDKIFFLTAQKFDIFPDKIIYLDELAEKFILRTYVEIPFLHFLQKNPKIKLFLTNFPIIIKNEHNTTTI